MFRPVTFILVIAITSPLFAQPHWEKISDSLVQSPRDGVAVLVFKRKIWFLGGWDQNQEPNLLNEVYKSADGKRFKKIENAPWPRRHSFGAVTFKKKMWVIGGDGHADVWVSANGKKWKCVVPFSPWGRRYKPYVFVFNDKLWLMGGFSFYDQYELYNDIWSSEDGVNWKLEKDKAEWSPRGAMHGVALLDNKVWILGGGAYGPPPTHKPEIYLNDVWNSEDGVNWKLVSSEAPWDKRIHHSIHTFANRLWVLAGHNFQDERVTLRNDCWYSADGVNWVELRDSPWGKRHAATLFTFKNDLYLAFGYLYNDLWKLILHDFPIEGNPVPATSED